MVLDHHECLLVLLVHSLLTSVLFLVWLILIFILGRRLGQHIAVEEGRGLSQMTLRVGSYCNRNLCSLSFLFK